MSDLGRRVGFCSRCGGDVRQRHHSRAQCARCHAKAVAGRNKPSQPNVIKTVVAKHFDEYRVRQYAGESNFVASSWLRNYLSSPWGRHVTHDEFWYAHGRLVSRLIDRCNIFVAESTVHEGLLYGFIVGERDEMGPVVHYALVKSDFREAGIGSSLTRALMSIIRKSDDEQVRYTHTRSPGSEIAGRWRWVYTPYPAFRFGWDNK